MTNSYRFWFMIYSIAIFKNQKKEINPVSVLLLYHYLIYDKIPVNNQGEEMKKQLKIEKFLIDKYLFSEIEVLVEALDYYYKNEDTLSIDLKIKLNSEDKRKLNRIINIGEYYEY